MALTGSPQELLQTGADKGTNALKRGWRGYKKQIRERAMPWVPAAGEAASGHTEAWRDPIAHQEALAYATGQKDWRKHPGVEGDMQAAAQDAARALNMQGHSWGGKAAADIQKNVFDRGFQNRQMVLNPLIALSGLGLDASKGQAAQDMQVGGAMSGLWQDYGKSRYQHGSNLAGINMDMYKNAASLQAAQDAQEAANQNALMSGIIGAVGTIGGGLMGGPAGAAFGSSLFGGGKGVA